MFKHSMMFKLRILMIKFIKQCFCEGQIIIRYAFQNTESQYFKEE